MTKEQYHPGFQCQVCRTVWPRPTEPEPLECPGCGQYDRKKVALVLFNPEDQDVVAIPAANVHTAPMRKAKRHETYRGRLVLECGHTYLCSKEELEEEIEEIGCSDCWRDARKQAR